MDTLVQSGSNLSSILTYCFLLWITYFIYKVLIKPFLSPLRRIPGPGYHNPIYGNVREAMQGEAMETSTKWVKKYGDIVRYYHLLGRERILIACPEGLKRMLVTNAKNYVRTFAGTSTVSRLVGQGILAVDGDYHRQQRKIFHHALFGEAVLNMVPVFQTKCQQVIDKWTQQLKSHCEGCVVDAQLDLTNMALDVVSQCAFSYNLNSISDPDNENVKALGFVTSVPSVSFQNTIPILNRIPTAYNKTYEKMVKVADDLVNNIISERQRNTDSDNPTDDILALLLKAHDPETGQTFSERELHDHIISFLIAGHETTAKAMSWALYMIAKHEDIQERAYKEAVQVLPPKEEKITWEYVDRLQYINCIIKETLRLYPTVPSANRKAVNDDKIGEYLIPAGTTVTYHVGALMRNARYWPEPEKFMPERFQDPEAVRPFTFLPFITGPHMCLGHKFAMLEMRLVLAMLLRDFKITTVPNMVFKRKTKVVMVADPPIKVHIASR
ncbi:cytochrome P450 4C1 [Lingula anatina]|uniref:Cytochrome P450 4C1 n=1 Tax=Lingula anatina TaxID=7574 RepID=A0A1S3HG20_LINAN|nr:cytochrome P450 4C1 [Lingula anatina]|eukprot:XP_013383979.1 cytochrome P450 4C1 [Lingula anatina]